MAKELTQDARERLDDAVGMTWRNFAARHPSQATAIEAQVGNPVENAIKTLANDEAYAELMATTEAETNIGNIVHAIAPTVIAMFQALA